MTVSPGDESEREPIIWCASCGIPYGAEAVYCSLCGKRLVENREEAAPPAPAAEPAENTAALAAALRASLAPRAGTSSERGPLSRRGSGATGATRRFVPRRQQSLSDDEIEAKAAAIVAQAQAEEQSASALGHPDLPARDLQAGDPPAVEPAPYLDFLPPLPERDRQWLIAGLICCVVLILFAVAFVRFLGGTG